MASSVKPDVQRCWIGQVHVKRGCWRSNPHSVSSSAPDQSAPSLCRAPTLRLLPRATPARDPPDRPPALTDRQCPRVIAGYSVTACVRVLKIGDRAWRAGVKACLRYAAGRSEAGHGSGDLHEYVLEPAARRRAGMLGDDSAEAVELSSTAALEPGISAARPSRAVLSTCITKRPELPRFSGTRRGCRNGGGRDVLPPAHCRANV